MQNYEQLNEMLIASGAGFHASECHGFLCALVCGNGQAQEQKIREYFLLGSDEIVNADECFSHLKALAEDIEVKMYSSDLDLVLLLADEDDALAERGRSLAEWCHGFMSGMGLSGVKDEQIPSESQELIGDFYKIANLDADNENDKDDSDQENDFALMELIEYVRMGTIYIFEDLQGNVDNPENCQPRVLH
ncbi:MAG: UPF0149 family protein [Gammaproteobacteria bacterium]